MLRQTIQRVLTLRRKKSRAGIIVSAHSGGLTMIDIPSGRMFVCNEAGSQIWTGLAQGKSRNEIVQSLALDYGIALDRAQRDVTAFLTELAAAGFSSESTEIRS